MSKPDTLCRLQNEILSLQGYKPATSKDHTDFGLGNILAAFPNATFPFSALHEFLCESPQEVAASNAFVTGLLAPLLHKGGIALWIGTHPLVFPPGLKAFGINPDQIIFINVRSCKDAIWTVEEALKSTAIKSVIGEVAELHFTDSRRFQLLIEQSGVGCFMVRHKPRNLTTASTTRWHIKPLESRLEDNLPGVGYPRWNVNLLKVRGGRPGSWDMEWARGRFRHTSKLAMIPRELQTKTG